MLSLLLDYQVDAFYRLSVSFFFSFVCVIHPISRLLLLQPSTSITASAQMQFHSQQTTNNRQVISCIFKIWSIQSRRELWSVPSICMLSQCIHSRNELIAFRDLDEHKMNNGAELQQNHENTWTEMQTRSKQKLLLLNLLSKSARIINSKKQYVRMPVAVMVQIPAQWKF